jgi:hypothetical protein
VKLDGCTPTITHEEIVDGLTCAIEYAAYSSTPVPRDERSLAYVALFVEGCCVQTIQGGQSFDEVVSNTRWPEYIRGALDRGWLDLKKIDEDEAAETRRHEASLSLLARRRELAR